MVNLVYSQILGRNIRSDPWEELGTSTWTKIKEAIQAGRTQEALDLVDYLKPEGKVIHDSYCDWTYADLSFLAQNFGEEQVYYALRNAAEVLGKSVFARGAYAKAPGAKLAVEDVVRQMAETMRAHRCGRGENGDITITEEEEKYVISFDPCGSGGRMRRVGELDNLPPRTGPLYNLGRTSKPYPWSWSKANVPYYCCHCCVWQEIMPIESRGYPVRIIDYNDDPAAACAWIFYKDPERIPEEYFTRVGKTKDVSKFVR